MVPAVKKIAIIPTLLTLGNAVCGFAAIAYASKVDGTPATEAYFARSGWLIIAAMLFDALDGYVARLARSASKFGGELDSLCDGVSFGLAPAFLLMRTGPGWEQPFLHRALAGIAALYLVCALLRLARFNVESLVEPAGDRHRRADAPPHSARRFRGLPSPGAAGCLASLAILRGELAGMATRWKWDLDLDVFRSGIEVWATLGALVIALLMVSRVPYPHLTKQILRGRRHFSHLVQVIVAAFVLVLFREFALVLVFWVYGLGVALRYAVIRSLRHDPFRAPAAPGVDDVRPR